MPSSTMIHGITYPIPADLLKDPAQAAKLARDLQALAVSADAALTANRAAASAEASAAESGAKTYTDTEVAGVRSDARGWAEDAEAAANAYTDVSFAASGPGGATDEQVDAAIDRAVARGVVGDVEDEDVDAGIDRAVAEGRVPDGALLPEGGAQAVGKGELAVRVEDHGAIGDGVNNDRWRIQEAINTANGRDVLLHGGRTYRIQGTLIMPTWHRHVSIKGTGAEPAVLYTNGQSNRVLEFDAGAPVAVKTLVQSVTVGAHGWVLEDTVGVEAGMICEVVSDASWYFDPRPETAPTHDARRSELHRIKRIDGGTIYMDDPANDGYDLSSEAVEIRVYNPIHVHLENITVRAVHPPAAEETNALEGIVVRGAVSPTLVNVNVENCARTGVAVYRSYRPRIIGGYTRGANNYWNGYGLSINGCAWAHVKDRITFDTRRAVDITGFNVISRNSLIEGCIAVGGGTNSRGDTYGWLPNGALGASQSGFGTHGASDNATYLNCVTFGIQRPFSFRGRAETVINPLVLGPAYGGVFQLSWGTSFWLKGGVVSSNAWAYKMGNPNVGAQRADYLVRCYAAYQTNPPEGDMYGRLTIEGVNAEVQHTVLFFDQTTPAGRVTVANNDIYFGPTDTTVPRVFYNNGLAPDEPDKSRWFVGPNRLSNETTAASPVLGDGVSLAGAKVLDYTTAT